MQSKICSVCIKFIHILIFYASLFFSVLLFPSIVITQTVFPQFERISIEHGLSQSTITCIMQDRKGFIWIGTRDGLNKYDGYNFRVFRNDPSDSTSISDNSVTSIAEGENRDIWIGTGTGFINRLDLNTEKFSSYKLYKDPLFSENTNQLKEIPPCYSFYDNNTVTCLCFDNNGNLWAGTWGKGLFNFDVIKRKFIGHQFKIEDENSLSSNYILSVKKDKNGILWIGTFGNGLDKMKVIKNVKSKSSYYKFENYSGSNNSLGNDKVTSICFDKDENNLLWVGTFGGGVNKLKYSDNSDSVNFSLPGEKSISSLKITQICSDERGSLWIGTFGNGLVKFDLKKNKVVVFKNNPLDDDSINDNDVIALAADRSGLIWSGTLSGYGINKLNPDKTKFLHYKSNPLDKSSLSDNVVLTFSEDKDDNIWIGTYKGGLNKFNRNSNSFSSYKNKPNDKFSINSNYITAVCSDSDNNLWIGTFNSGLNFFNKKSNRFSHFTYDINNKYCLSDNRITSITIDKSGIIWIGTYGGGLNKAVKNDSGTISFIWYKKSELYAGTLPDNRVEKIFEDKDGIIWVATYSGSLCRFDKRTNEFTNYKINTNDNSKPGEIRILSVCEDVSGNLWLGTYGKGLISFDKKKGRFIINNYIPNLSTNIIYGLLKDYENIFWISSDKGLFKYNPRSNSVSSFDLSDGLQSMQFNSGSAFKSKNGEMFFGGINGFNCFFPEKLKTDLNIPQVLITSVKTSAGKSPQEGNTIKLSHYNNSITFEFAAMDFTNPAQNQFAFRLTGYENDWHYLSGGQHSASYENLPPGKYIFRLKGSNSAGNWNKNEVYLSVIISPPFWKSLWFILILIISIGGFISYFIINRIYRFLAIEKLKSRISADLHDTVGSGLTEISLLSEIISKEMTEKNEVIKEKLKSMNERAGTLINDMSDIVWLVNPKHDMLYDLILRLKDLYSPIYESLGISFRVHNLETLQNLKISMEYRQNIYLIFKEAINNCLKHSECESTGLSVEMDNKILEMTLADDGKGFNKNKLSRGNGLKNMQQRAGLIKGELEIFSSLGKGTKIVLSVKLK